MFNGTYDLFLLIAVIYVVLYLVDILLKFLLDTSYTLIKKKFGINIQPFQLRWFTPSFNRCVQKLGTWRPKFQKAWFSLGMWITLFWLPFAVYFIVQSTYALALNTVWRETKQKRATSPFLEPIVPGVNLPVTDTGYYVFTLLICSVFHELGHATAAVREGMHITGFGFMLVFIFPVAYVRLEGVETLSAVKQLKIYCAGVWHNIVLTFAASLLLLLLPWLSYPFYEFGNGVQVTSIHKNSPLQEEGGLKINEIILGINKCEISNQDTWIKCIYQIAKNPVLGYCVTSEFIHENDESMQVRRQNNVVECCDNDTSSKICFEYLETGENPLELPQYSCLKARSVVEQSLGLCSSSEDCSGLHCFRPSLSNGTKLIEIERKNQNNVLFLGYPIEVLHGVHISEFIKSTYLSTAIPNAIAKFCNFLIMFSGALAALNLIPCFYFDGQYITRLIVNICLAKSTRFKKLRLIIALSITIMGSYTLVVYTFLTFYWMFLKLY